MFWTSAFLDFAPEDFDAGCAHWRGVTGYDLSPTRGEDGEFATLVPPRGDDYLRVQRLGEGPSRLHLDLHVHHPKVAAHEAVHLGATIVADQATDQATEQVAEQGFVVMTSPGGLTFCFVSHEAADVPEPTDWGGGLVSMVDQVCIDIPDKRYDAEVAFWQTLTGWDLRPPVSHPSFERLIRPDGYPLQILLQRLGEDIGQVRAHLDIATTDRARETERHVALGAEVVSVNDFWNVLTAPGTPAYCITERKPG